MQSSFKWKIIPNVLLLVLCERQIEQRILELADLMKIQLSVHRTQGTSYSTPKAGGLCRWAVEVWRVRNRGWSPRDGKRTKTLTDSKTRKKLKMNFLSASRRWKLKIFMAPHNDNNAPVNHAVIDAPLILSSERWMWMLRQNLSLTTKI